MTKPAATTVPADDRPGRQPRSRFPLLRLLAGTICISFSPVFIKLAAVPPDVAGFYRMLFAGLSLLVLLLLRGKRLRIGGKAALFLAAGGLSLAIDLMCWHRSIHLIGPGLSTLLANFQVFFTPLFAWLLFRQKVNRLFLLAVILAVGGLSLITGVDWPALAAGVRSGLLLAITAAVFYSGYLLLLKKGMDEPAASGLTAMLVVSASSTVLLGGVCLASGASLAIPDLPSWLALLGVGVLSTTIGWSLISTAMREIPVTLAGLFLLLQPALVFAWDLLLFQRPTQLHEWGGIALILVAIYLGSWRR